MSANLPNEKARLACAMLVQPDHPSESTRKPSSGHEASGSSKNTASEAGMSWMCSSDRCDQDGLDSAQTLEMSEIMAEVLHGDGRENLTPLREDKAPYDAVYAKWLRQIRGIPAVGGCELGVVACANPWPRFAGCARASP